MGVRELTRRLLPACLVAVGAGGAPGGGGAPPLLAQSYLPDLTDQQVAEARAALEAMKTDPRGPYLRIRWFCRDGSVQPPQGAPCRERGGGSQHAEFNDVAKRLAVLGIHTGTILEGTEPDLLLDSARVNDWPKQLLLEHYLVDVDDGWVLRRARYYRGARQAEDEERAGAAFLERVLSNPAWLVENYWLANQLVAVVPHPGPGGGQSVHTIRNLATEVAQLEAGFVALRVKIHSFPSRDDVRAVEVYARRSGLSADVRAKLGQLAAELRRYYDRNAQLQSLVQFESRLRGIAGIDESLREIAAGLERDRSPATLGKLAGLTSRIRSLVLGSRDGRRNLLLLDLNLALQEQAILLATELEGAATPRSRRERIANLTDYFTLEETAGLLSSRERQALDAAVRELAPEPSVPALEYKKRLLHLARGLEWPIGTVRSAMYPTLDRYARVEPAADGFVDATLRGSVLLPLSMAIGRLASDADSVLGAPHMVLGQAAGPGVRGLNPGVALGPLRIAGGEPLSELDRFSVYVLPETTPELRPVAGVLTLDAGNLLSHIQLLARNLGIPNATIPSSLLPVMEEAEGSAVFYAVSPLGRVVLEEAENLGEAEGALLTARNAARGQRHRLDMSRLKLQVETPIPLRNLRAHDSGVLVGPKAANLGQLAAFFPEHVSAGMALPFGMFYRHANRPFDSDRTVLQELSDAYTRAAELRAAGYTEDEIDALMLAALERVRRAIQELPWLPEMRARVVEAMQATFGTDVSAGIFVRSDTNVEDLPQFSGAGLNLTVPNQRTLEDVLASIKRVWTSPFTERAYLWRKQVLDEQGQVYPSVLLLRSVPSEKSGVLITSGLQHGGPEDLTIATAEGVGGAVEGEEAEVVLVDPSGSVKLLSQAKAPRRRVLAADGGARMVPSRRPEYLLSDEDIRQLRDVVRVWKERFPDSMPGRIWDLEFGFVGSHLWLFQIRPFVRFRDSQLLESLSSLDEEALRNAARPVSLSERI